MRIVSTLLLALGLGTLYGCGTMGVAPQITETVSAEPFVAVVPKNLINKEASLLKGLRLTPFKNKKDVGQPIETFYSVEFTENKEASQLETAVCRGDYHVSTQSTHSSCVYYDAKVSVSDLGESYKVSIEPFQVRTKKGKNAIFIPIKPPVVTMDMWYGWLSDHDVFVAHKAESKYSPESIKGNFDRKLENYLWGEGKKDAALRQYKTTYLMSLVGPLKAYVGASFYPYRDGTIVEFKVKGESKHEKGNKSVDWATGMNVALSTIDKTMKE